MHIETFLGTLLKQENFEKYILQIVRANLEYYSFDIEPEVMVKFYCGGMTNLFFLWFEDKSIKTEEINYQVKRIINLVKRDLLEK